MNLLSLLLGLAALASPFGRGAPKGRRGYFPLISALRAVLRTVALRNAPSGAESRLAAC